MRDDIEKILAKGVKNYEVIPPEQVWNNIKKGKKSRYIFFFKYYRWHIAASILLIAFISAGLYYFDISKNNKTAESNKKTEISKIERSKSFSEQNNSEINSHQSNESLSENNAQNNKSENISNTKNNSSNSNNSKVKIKEDDYNKTLAESNEEIIVDYVKYEVADIEPKAIPDLKYKIYPTFEDYSPVSKKFHKNYNNNKENKPEKDLAKGLYSLEFGGGPSYIYRQLNGGNYLLRNESEKSMISFQTNFKVNYNFNNKFSVQSGIIIETRNEKLKYNHTEMQKKLTETPRMVTVYHPVLPPKNITVIDSSYSNETVNYNFANLNKYTSFNIPVMFGYNFGNSKLQYRLSAGTLINIYSSNNAKIIERKGNETILVQYKESKKINPSIYSAAAINKVINNHYSIIFELSYYKNMLNRLGSESATKQKNAGFNFTSAIRYNILR